MGGESMNDWAGAEARVERAHELYERGQWVEAAAELRSAIRINPYNASWHFNLALALEAMEDYAKACDSFEKALKLDADDVETLNCLGINLTRLGKYSEALEHFRRVERIDPLNEPCFCNRIVAYTEMGDHEKAELMFYMARQIKEECPACYYSIGNSLFARGQYDRAIYCWRQTLRMEPSHPQANVRLAEAFWAKGELAQARDHYRTEIQRKAYDNRPQDPELLLDLGELLMDTNDLQEAEDSFRQAIEAADDNASAHYCLGELLLRKQDWPAAEASLRKSLELDEKYPGAHLKLAEALIRQKKVQEGAKHLVLELRHRGSDAEVLKEAGQLLLEAHQSRQANIVLRRLVKLQPADAHAQHNLAVSYFMMERLDEGIRYCRKALKLKPDYSLALYNLALAHLQLQQVPRARRYAMRALTAAPQDANIRRLARRVGAMGFWSRLKARVNPSEKPLA
ncbi:MAG: tetratricopeptide repeat protein [Phycisphaerae bacterium]|jgi:tetratricopeptide (TPR) repeat protein